MHPIHPSQRPAVVVQPVLSCPAYSCLSWDTGGTLTKGVRRYKATSGGAGLVAVNERDHDGGDGQVARPRPRNDAAGTGDPGIGGHGGAEGAGGAGDNGANGGPASMGASGSRVATAVPAVRVATPDQFRERSDPVIEQLPGRYTGCSHYWQTGGPMTVAKPSSHRSHRRGG